MALDREARFVALFERLKTVTNWKSTSRINLGWDEFLALEQPAMILVKTDEKQVQQQQNIGLPFLWDLGAMVVIYCRNTAPNVPPSTQLNALIRAVEASARVADRREGWTRRRGASRVAVAALHDARRSGVALHDRRRSANLGGHSRGDGEQPSRRVDPDRNASTELTITRSTQCLT